MLLMMLMLLNWIYNVKNNVDVVNNDLNNVKNDVNNVKVDVSNVNKDLDNLNSYYKLKDIYIFDITSLKVNLWIKIIHFIFLNKVLLIISKKIRI